MSARVIQILMAMVLAFLSCSRPTETSCFIPVEDADCGPYVFSVTMADSLKSYDFSFFTGTGCVIEEALKLDVHWIPEKGEGFGESVYLLPSKGDVQLYRSGVSSSCEEWKLVVNVHRAPDNFRGLGLLCKENGTR